MNVAKPYTTKSFITGIKVYSSILVLGIFLLLLIEDDPLDQTFMYIQIGVSLLFILLNFMGYSFFKKSKNIKVAATIPYISGIIGLLFPTYISNFLQGNYSNFVYYVLIIFFFGALHSMYIFFVSKYGASIFSQKVVDIVVWIPIMMIALIVLVMYIISDFTDSDLFVDWGAVPLGTIGVAPLIFLQFRRIGANCTLVKDKSRYGASLTALKKGTSNKNLEGKKTK